MQFNFFICLGFLLLLASCSQKYSTNDLDQFGRFVESEIKLKIEGQPDSLRLEMQSGQPLSGVNRLDTTLDLVHGPANFSWKVVLDRPSIVKATFNHLQQEFFLFPGRNYDLSINVDSNRLLPTFADKDMQSIYLYSESKAEIGGDLLLRNLVSSALTQPTLENALDSLDAMETRLFALLGEAKRSLDLPDWFTEFEETNIKYSNLVFKAGAPRVRKLMFGMQDTIPFDFDPIYQTFDINSELAMTTHNFLSSLPSMIQTDCALGQIDLDPINRMTQYYNKSNQISNSRVRDVFRSYLYYRVQSSSVFYPDSLVSRIRTGVSDDMQSYLDWVDLKHNQLNGAPAPPIHLLDSTKSLVSLKDFEGNLVLLDFWFVGCRFCKLENPHMKSLIEKFGNEPFKVLHICMKSSWDSWRNQVMDFPGIPLYSNPNWDTKLENSYKISGYPRYVLVDEDGMILEGWCERPSDPMLEERISAKLNQVSLQ